MDVTWLYDSRAALGKELEARGFSGWFDEENRALLEAVRQTEEQESWIHAYAGFGPGGAGFGRK